jgi:hypothetical protein
VIDLAISYMLPVCKAVAEDVVEIVMYDLRLVE